MAEFSSVKTYAAHRCRVRAPRKMATIEDDGLRHRSRRFIAKSSHDGCLYLTAHACSIATVQSPIPLIALELT